MTQSSEGRAHRIAVVGAGAVGIHATDLLVCMRGHNFFVDLFDASPSPTGLIQFASEHRRPAVHGAARVPSIPRVRLFGGIQVGRDITVGELMGYYDVVVVASEASEAKEGGLLVIGTSDGAATVTSLLGEFGEVAVERGVVVGTQSEHGAIVVLLEARGLGFTTWRGWYRPAGAENAWNYAVHSGPTQAGVTVAQWQQLVAVGRAVPDVP